MRCGLISDANPAIKIWKFHGQGFNSWKLSVVCVWESLKDMSFKKKRLIPNSTVKRIKINKPLILWFIAFSFPCKCKWNVFWNSYHKICVPHKSQPPVLTHTLSHAFSIASNIDHKASWWGYTHKPTKLWSTNSLPLEKHRSSISTLFAQATPLRYIKHYFNSSTTTKPPYISLRNHS